MQIYLVGGAVRNELLGLPVRERDWVVVGATPNAMTTLGYKPIGKSFPVFLHPQSKEEYALARTEKKTAPGYTGFSINAAPGVSLEEDLLRRDLTINAIAQDSAGELIDPYGGRADLDARVLRHVSSAFAEDPVRILRVARFRAQLGQFDFRIATETLQLMGDMVSSGEINALVPERVWKETEKALQTDFPQHFFDSLRACGAMSVLFPELDRLYGVPQNPLQHPEVDTGIHTMMVLTQAARLSPDPVIKFAALVHDLGKATTDPALWPKHVGHEENAVPLIHALCERLKIPNSYRTLGVLVARYHLHYHRIDQLTADAVLELLQGLDVFRRPDRLQQFLTACEADSRGRLGFEDSICEQSGILTRLHAAACSITARDFKPEQFSGPALGQALAAARINAIASVQPKKLDSVASPCQGPGCFLVNFFL